MTHRHVVSSLKRARLFIVCLSVMLYTGLMQAQVDPGPRGGAAGAGGPSPSSRPDIFVSDLYLPSSAGDASPTQAERNDKLRPSFYDHGFGDDLRSANHNEFARVTHRGLETMPFGLARPKVRTATSPLAHPSTALLP